MKDIKMYLSLIIFLTILYAQSISVYAESSEHTWQYFDGDEDYMLNICWTDSLPSLELISPSGEQYDVFAYYTDDDQPGGSSLYLLEDPEKGQWNILLDKLDNPTVEIGIMPYYSKATITDLVISEPDSNGIMTVSFNADHKENLKYGYKIYAVAEDIDGSKLLCEGDAITNNSVITTVDLTALASYDYALEVRATFIRNDIDYFDQAVSDTFTWKNKDTWNFYYNPEICLVPEEYYIEVEKIKVTDDIEEVMVALYINDETEPDRYFEYAPDDDNYSMIYPREATKLKVEITPKINGVYREARSYEADLTGITMDLPIIPSTRNFYYDFSYEVAHDTTATVIVNESTLDLSLIGSGKKRFTLFEFENNLSLKVPLTDKFYYRYDRTVFVDRVPPILTMGDYYHTMVTNKTTLEVYGEVSDAVSVTVNGVEVEVDEEGIFFTVIALSASENDLLVKAYDSVGNAVQYMCSVKCTAFDAVGSEEGDPTLIVKTAEANNYQRINEYDLLSKAKNSDSLILMASTLVGAVVAVYAILFWKKGV